MAGTRAYYADGGLSAAHYDLITSLDPFVAGDVDIYANLAPNGGSVLELGAGTGRVALGLAALGLTVTGIERAPAMLRQARAKLAAADPETAARVTLVQGDMTALTVSGPFDLAVCAYYGLAHLPAGAAWRNVLRGVVQRLKPGGGAAFHQPRVEALALPPPDPDRILVEAPVDDAGRRLRIQVLDRGLNTRIGRFDQDVGYVVIDAAGRTVERSRERLTYYTADMTPYAVEAGLEPDGPPLPMGAAGEILVFRKP